MTKSCVVVGAGLSGLATAWYLSEAGANVRVVEVSAGPGGLISTRRPPEGLVEPAARGFVWTDRVAALFKSAGVEPLFARDQSKRRFIYRNGKPRRWPLGPIETGSLLAHAAAASVTRSMKPRDGESVAVWAKRVVGRGAADWLIAPVLQGIYASPTDQLSARAIFGGSRLRGKLAAPATGMSELFEALRSQLAARGATFEFGARVADLTSLAARSEPVAVCTSAPDAAPLVAPHAPRLAEAIGRVRMTSLLSVTAFYPPAREDTSGFGILFPRSAGLTALGVLFNSDMFDGRGDLRSETWIYGDQSAEAIARIQSSIETVLRHDRRQLTHRDIPPAAVYPTPQIARLPIYDAAILDVSARLGDLPPWLGLCGNYLGRLGVSAIVDIAYETAARLVK